MRNTRATIIVAAVLLMACGGIAAQEAATETFTIQFTARIGEEAVACGVTYAGLGVGQTDVQVADFRFYVADVRLIDADGGETPLAFDQDGLWQYENVALLDFEDGGEGCGEGGNVALNDTVYGTAPPGEYTGVAFTLGVPFALNHQDVTAAPAPLNLGAMFWSWQGGYKFARIDLLTEATELPGYFIHLGSTGCESASSVVAPEKACARPNRVEVRLEGFDPARDVIVADLASLVAGVDLGDNTPEPPGCMSGPTDPDCAAVFAGFGLSLETGVCADDDCAGQAFFRVLPDAKTAPSTTREAGVMSEGHGH